MRAFILLAACVVAALATNPPVTRYQIPNPFVWDESFKVFYNSLDEQHKGLFNAISDSCGSPTCADTLKALKKVIHDHFRFEEDMMKKSSYGDLDEHKELHREFEEKLNEKQVTTSTQDCLSAKDWMVNHIKITDFKYKGKLME